MEHLIEGGSIKQSILDHEQTTESNVIVDPELISKLIPVNVFDSEAVEIPLEGLRFTHDCE